VATHSVGEEQAETCFFEGWAGGRIMEVLKDGSQSEWGKVIAWEPFQRVSFHWYPGRTPDTAQKVTVTFSEIPGGTLVELVHVGWETIGRSIGSTEWLRCRLGLCAGESTLSGANN
jgi:hypothetical protein